MFTNKIAIFKIVVKWYCENELVSVLLVLSFIRTVTSKNRPTGSTKSVTINTIVFLQSYRIILVFLRMALQVSAEIVLLIAKNAMSLRGRTFNVQTLPIYLGCNCLSMIYVYSVNDYKTGALMTTIEKYTSNLNQGQ